MMLLPSMLFSRYHASSRQCRWSESNHGRPIFSAIFFMENCLSQPEFGDIVLVGDCYVPFRWDTTVCRELDCCPMVPQGYWAGVAVRYENIFVVEILLAVDKVSFLAGKKQFDNERSESLSEGQNAVN